MADAGGDVGESLAPGFGAEAGDHRGVAGIVAVEPDVWLSAPSATIAGSPLRQTDIDVRGSVSVVGVRPIHDPVTDTPRAPRRARAATRTLGPLSCADALSLHRRFAISTSCALAAADVRLEQEAHRARY